VPGLRRELKHSFVRSFIIDAEKMFAQNSNNNRDGHHAYAFILLWGGKYDPDA